MKKLVLSMLLALGVMAFGTPAEAHYRSHYGYHGDYCGWRWSNYWGMWRWRCRPYTRYYRHYHYPYDRPLFHHHGYYHYPYYRPYYRSGFYLEFNFGRRHYRPHRRHWHHRHW